MSGIRSENTPAQPPIANRGVVTLKPPKQGAQNTPYRAGLDYLSVTCPAGRSADHALQSISINEGKGKPTSGFSASSVISVGGAMGYRKTGPVYPSKNWGSDYLCYELSGPNSQLLAASLRPDDELRSSRIDIAFDFKVPADYMADQLADELRQHHMDLGIISGINGQGDVNTRYIGSKTSDRRIRIYRKDLRDAELFATTGPVLRIELILKGKHARKFFHEYLLDPDDSLRVAAGHILEMTGLNPLPREVVTPPPLDRGFVGDAAQEVFQFVRQNGQQLEAFRAAGIDLNDLADCFGRPPQPSKMQEKRRRDRISRITAHGVSEVLQGVGILLRGTWAARGATT